MQLNHSCPHYTTFAPSVHICYNVGVTYDDNVKEV